MATPVNFSASTTSGSVNGLMIPSGAGSGPVFTPLVSYSSSNSIFTISVASNPNISISFISSSDSYVAFAINVAQLSIPPAAATGQQLFSAIWQTQTIPSYLYVQYNDDDNLNAFVQSYNGMTQQYVQWFSSVNIANYTTLSGLLLDWIGQGLYGYTRPVFASVGTALTGPVGTFIVGTLVLAGGLPGTPSSYSTATDDIYARCLTWHLYKGDGRYFTIPWLKNRVLRFLYGTNGIDIGKGNTSTVSVTIAGTTVTINISNAVGVPSALLNIFQYAVQGGILALPSTFTWVVTV